MSQINITDGMLDYVQAHGVTDVRAIAMLMVKYHKQQQTAPATGNRPAEPKCALGKNMRSPADEETIRKMRARAWHEQGVGMIEPAKLANSSEKLWLMGYFEQQYGKRRCDNDDNPMNPFED